MAVERVIIEIVGDATKINDTISQLEKLGKVDKANADSFRKNNQQTQNAIVQTGKDVGYLTSQMQGLGQAVAGAFAIQQLAAFGQESLKVAAKMDSVSRSLSFIVGGAKEAERTLDFLRKLSEKLGLEFVSTASAFKSFASAATKSGVTLNDTKAIFEQVSKAVVTMGLSAEDAEGVFLALSQIMSKGTVQAEELRGQIGERIPGAFGIAARAIGVTEQQLNKMLEQGQVLSKDFLPKFAKQLETDLGGGAEKAADGMQANLNRLENMWTGFKNFFGAYIVYPLVAGLKGIFVDTPKMLLDDLSRIFSKKSVFEGSASLAAQFQAITDNFTKLEVRIANAKTKKELETLGSITNKYFNTLDKGMSEAANGQYLQVMDALADKYNSLSKSQSNATTEQKKATEAKKEHVKEVEKELTGYARLLDDIRKLEAAMRDTLALNGIVSPKAIQQLDELKFKIQSIELAMKNLNDPALKNAGGQKMGITSELPDQLPTGDFGAAAEKQQYDELLQLHQEFINELEVQDKGYSENYLDELKRRQDAEKENMEIVIGGLYEVLGNAVNTYFQATSQTSQMVLDNQLENIKELYDNQIYSEQQYEQKKKELLNKDAERQHEMALFQGATQAALGILFAMQGDPYTLAARVAVAAAIGAANVALIAAQPVPQFAEGTERVTGGVKGKDSVHALLMPDEAVIKANENMSYPGLSKAWNDGNLEGFIYKNWVLPELIMHKSNENLIQQSFADNVAKSIQLNQDFGAIENKLKRIEQAEKEGAIFIANEVKSAIKTNYRNRY